MSFSILATRWPQWPPRSVQTCFWPPIWCFPTYFGCLEVKKGDFQKFFNFFSFLVHFFLANPYFDPSTKKFLKRWLIKYFNIHLEVAQICYKRWIGSKRVYLLKNKGGYQKGSLMYTLTFFNQKSTLISHVLKTLAKEMLINKKWSSRYAQTSFLVNQHLLCLGVPNVDENAKGFLCLLTICLTCLSP